MENLFSNNPIRLRVPGSTSVASLTVEKRDDGSINFRQLAETETETEAETDDKNRYLRITNDGRTDLKGKKNGIWTIFNASSSGNSSSFTQKGVKSGFWLTVKNGQFKSSDIPYDQYAEFAGKTEIIDKPPKSTNPEIDLNQENVTLTTADGFVISYITHIKNTNEIVFLGTNTGNLAFADNGKMHQKGKKGIWAQWNVEKTGDGLIFKNKGHEKYLALDGDTPILSDKPSIFSITSIKLKVEAPVDIDMSALSPEDIAFFKKQGYIILKNAVPDELIHKALRSINYQLGKPDCWEVDPNPLNAAQLSIKLPPKDGIGSEIVNQSPKFWSAINILFGKGNIAPYNGDVQCALRFPQAPKKGDIEDIRPGRIYHIDGMGQNKLCPFSLLCGVALSDQSKPSSGNLHVFPGSHQNDELHSYYRDFINDDNQNEEDSRKPDMGTAVQVLLQPGDVILAHQLLAHRVGLNYSHNIRYQLYYRLKHREHDQLRKKVIDGPWTEYAI